MKTRISITIALSCLLLPLSARTAEEAKTDPGITNRVQTLLDAYAMSDDMMDVQLMKKRAELESMGEKAYPALCALLKKNDDPIYQSAIIDVFLRTDGDSKEPLKAIREFLNAHRDSKYAPAHRAALKYLGAKGGPEDASILAEYTDVNDLVTKTIAGKSKAMIEKRAAHPPSNTAHGSGGTNNATGNAGK